MTDEAKKLSVKQQNAQITRALGVFLSGFGAIVLFSLLFTESVAGKITNLIAGLILVLIGGMMVFFGNRQNRS